MINKSYTTEEKLKAFLNESITSGEADDAINSAVDLVDRLTGRNFIADSVASVRLFSGNDKQIMTIDECVEITKVEKGNNYYGDSFVEISEFVQESNATGYTLLPLNYSSLSIPIRQIHLRTYFWIKGFGNHRITAKWGYSVSVPKAIELATTILAGGIYMYNKGGGSGNIKSEKIDLYSVSYKSEDDWQALSNAIKTLKQYQKPIL